MTPREYLENVVRPNMAEVNDDTGDIRKVSNAAASIDALGARIYHWGVNHEPPLIERLARDDDGYREKLEGENADYHLLCDVARAFKHVRLRERKRKPRLVHAASQISPETLMVDDMEDFDSDWTEAPCVLIQSENERPLIARNVLRRALEFLERRLDKLEVT